MAQLIKRLTVALVLVALFCLAFCDASKLKQQMLLNGEMVKVRKNYPALYQFLDVRDDLQEWSEAKPMFYDASVGLNVHYIDFTSGKWLTEADSNIHVWKHRMAVIIPANGGYRNNQFCSMYITSCNNNDEACMTSQYNTFKLYAAYSGLCMVMLYNNNPGPVQFPHLNDTSAWRLEDAVLSQTYMKIINDPTRPDWCLTLPMTRAAKVALDVLEEWSAAKVTEGVLANPINYFHVWGVSKRALTSYLLAAYEGSKRTKFSPTRLLAIGGISYTALNYFDVIIAQSAAIGGFTEAFYQFRDADMLPHFNTPSDFEHLIPLVDPMHPQFEAGFSKVPVLVATGTADQFFMPTDPRYFAEQIKDFASYTLLPQTNHAMVSPTYPALLNSLMSVAAHAKGASKMIDIIEADKARPCIIWYPGCASRKFVRSFPDIQPALPTNTFDRVQVTKGKKSDKMIFNAIAEKPASLQIWYATNPGLSDWRNTTIAWTSINIDISQPKSVSIDRKGVSTYRYEYDMQSIIDAKPAENYFAMYFMAQYFIDGTPYLATTEFTQIKYKLAYESCLSLQNCGLTPLLPYH